VLSFALLLAGLLMARARAEHGRGQAAWPAYLAPPRGFPARPLSSSTTLACLLILLWSA